LRAPWVLPWLLGTSGSVGASESPREEVAQRWHIGTAAGVGHAYGILGLQLQVRRGQFAGLLSAGWAGPPIIGGGIRWYPGGDSGLVLSLHGTHTLEIEPMEPLTVLAATVGWRFRWEPGDWKEKGRGVFAEFGIGPAFYSYKGEDGVRRGFGALGPDGAILPDVAIAFGAEW
jgi:hypothetical protein